MLIYKATNIINNKSYIGLTTRTLQERKLEHLRHIKTENTYFHRAINEYGKDNFLWEIIDDTPSSIKELKEKESYYIQYFNTLAPNGYNITTGGELIKIENRRDYNYGNNPSAKRVINLTTLKVYDTMKRAAEENNISVESIRKSIKNKTPSQNCFWDYYDENKNYSSITPTKLQSSNSRKKVKNIQTGEIFNTITAAADAYHIARKTIRDSCNGEKQGNWEYVF